MSFAVRDEAERGAHRPRVGHVDKANRMVALGADPAEPVPGAADQFTGAFTHTAPRQAGEQERN